MCRPSAISQRAMKMLRLLNRRREVAAAVRGRRVLLMVSLSLAMIMGRRDRKK